MRGEHSGCESGAVSADALGEEQQAGAKQLVHEEGDEPTQQRQDEKVERRQQDDEEQANDADDQREEENEAASSPALFDVPIEKTEKGGFGIYFTKRETPDGVAQLVVDGFVEVPVQDVDAHGDDPSEKDATKDALRELLVVGDVLVSVNGTDCLQMEAMKIIALLRAAPLGGNTLQFSREKSGDQLESTPERRQPDASPKKDTSASITKSFIGALRKVKTKIKEGIEGDEELLQREQEEKELFEKAWLAEFDRLKREYETKWETCTYTADEFCGLLYHSGDQQQKEYLLREYPLLMDAWKDVNLSAASLRVRPDWPVPRVVCAAVVKYRCPVLESSANDSDMGNSHGDSESTAASPLEVSAAPQARDIHSSPPMHQVLDALRRDFAWRRTDVCALAKRLEAADIVSCSDLVDALEARGSRFERAFQSAAYPRLTKAICRSVHAHARHFARTHEDLGGVTGELKKRLAKRSTPN